MWTLCGVVEGTSNKTSLVGKLKFYAERAQLIWRGGKNWAPVKIFARLFFFFFVFNFWRKRFFFGKSVLRVGEKNVILLNEEVGRIVSEKCCDLNGMGHSQVNISCVTSKWYSASELSVYDVVFGEISPPPPRWSW